MGGGGEGGQMQGREREQDQRDDGERDKQEHADDDQGNECKIRSKTWVRGEGEENNNYGVPIIPHWELIYSGQISIECFEENGNEPEAKKRNIWNV